MSTIRYQQIALESITPKKLSWPQITESVSPTTASGQIVSVVKEIGPIVQTGDGLLLLRSVQLPGKRVQTGWDFANGLRLQPGEQLGNG